ncbi:MAG: LON peptidase substrate-binding domain-containing protein [Pseudomonadota bacterium]
MPELQTFTLPVFPLGSVLYPDGLLPLRIFEPRYLAMVRDCLREQRGFAVCLISEGRETGQAARFHPVGTLAQIEDHDQDAAGMLHITVRGEQRLQVVTSRVRADQLILGEALRLEAEPVTGVAERHRPLVKLLRQAMEEYDPDFGRAEELMDASWVGFRLAELLPLPPARRQWLLEVTNPTLRLEALAQFIDELRIGDEMQKR